MLVGKEICLEKGSGNSQKTAFRSGENMLRSRNSTLVDERVYNATRGSFRCFYRDESGRN